tara:strand:+ start:1253 stop:1585 length:333 start_codon:yes stop_codon:yes gene_type:complete
MKKLIDWWFDAEQIAMNMYQSEYFGIVIKILKTVILFVFCVVSFACVLLYKITKALFKNVPQQDTDITQPPVVSSPLGAVNYSKYGLPEELGKKGEGMSQNDYENLRKVL